MGEWKDCCLGEVCKFQRGYDITQREQKYGIYPVVSSSGIKSFHDGFKVKGPGVVIGRKGTLGTSFYIKSDFWPHDTTLWVSDFKGNNPLYIFYFLKTLELENYDVGSSNPTLNRNHIHLLEVKIPTLDDQRLIASVLSSLDDKIDLLHRQNATLEKMAETLFRQWFVKEAKEEEVELGEFASNIKVNARVEDLLNHENYIGLEHIPRKSISIFNWGKPDRLGSNKSVFEENDILFGKLRSYFHKVIFAPVSGICSTDILVIRPKNKAWFSFCLFWFSTEEVVNYSDLGSGGTRMPRTSWEIIKSYKIPKPSIEKIEDFHEKAEPMINKIKLNQTQIRILNAMRDNLLPKVMSGEVRVEV